MMSSLQKVSTWCFIGWLSAYWVGLRRKRRGRWEGPWDRGSGWRWPLVWREAEGRAARSCASTFGLTLSCRNLEILHKIWARGSAFPLCTRPCKLCSRFRWRATALSGAGRAEVSPRKETWMRVTVVATSCGSIDCQRKELKRVSPARPGIFSNSQGRNVDLSEGTVSENFMGGGFLKGLTDAFKATRSDSAPAQ